MCAVNELSKGVNSTPTPFGITRARHYRKEMSTRRHTLWLISSIHRARIAHGDRNQLLPLGATRDASTWLLHVMGEREDEWDDVLIHRNGVGMEAFEY
jgi:hypothetical protein